MVVDHVAVIQLLFLENLILLPAAPAKALQIVRQEQGIQVVQPVFARDKAVFWGIRQGLMPGTGSEMAPP